MRMRDGNMPYEWSVSSEPRCRRIADHPDPRKGELRSGDFRRDLTHEFGHLLAAQEQSFRIDFLGLYGLRYGSDSIEVTKGGLVLSSSSIATEWQWATVAVAGLVAERLSEGSWTPFDSEKLFSSDPALAYDVKMARSHIIAERMRSLSVKSIEQSLRRAMRAAAELLQPHMDRVRESVLHLERVMLEQRTEELEIAWTPEHAALLSGRSADWFRVRCDEP